MPNLTQHLIGLTGGIATGKTTVSHYLANTYKLPILDADIYAREAVEPGSLILDDIFRRYEKSIRLPDGTLNRKQLGEIIFNNPEEKRWLEEKIHPYVRQCFESKTQSIKKDTIVLVIPLLFEAKMTDLVTEIWVVYCPIQEQIKRLTERDKFSKKEAIARINSQLPIQEKIAAANVVLDNSSSLENLLKQIDLAFNKVQIKSN